MTKLLHLAAIKLAKEWNDKMRKPEWYEFGHDKAEKTTAERRRDQQIRAAERRLRQMAAKREKDAKRAAAKNKLKGGEND